MVWDLTSDDGVTVTTTTTSSDTAVAGIIATAVATPDTEGLSASQAVGDSNWTWLQTYGKANVNLVATTTNVGVAGSAMGTSATAGEAIVHTVVEDDARTYGFAGFWYDTATAGDDGVEVFLKGLD